MKKFELKIEGRIAKIKIDGKEVNRILSYKIEHTAGDLPEITIKFEGDELDVETETKVSIKEYEKAGQVLAEAIRKRMGLDKD